MSVWLTIPSAKAPAEAQACVDLWRSRGYHVALWRDQEDAVDCDLKLVGQYPGYAAACNALIREVMARHEDAAWFICAGDDIEPDQTKMADEIAAECDDHFRYLNRSIVALNTIPYGSHYRAAPMSGDGNPAFGVMQPTGDRWGEDPTLPNLHPLRTAYIDRVAGSAWYGREYCQRMYGGNGPLCEAYMHMHVDEEAQAVAELMGVFWQRPDLTQLHRHWQREKKAMPGYLAEVNGPKHWQESRQLFEVRKAAGFPGHEPVGYAISASVLAVAGV